MNSPHLLCQNWKSVLFKLTSQNQTMEMEETQWTELKRDETFRDFKLRRCSFRCYWKEGTWKETFRRMCVWAFVCSSCFTFFWGKVGQDKLQAFTLAEQHPYNLASFFFPVSFFIPCLSHFFPPSLFFSSIFFLSPTFHIFLSSTVASSSLYHVKPSSRLLAPEQLCLRCLCRYCLWSAASTSSHPLHFSHCRKYWSHNFTSFQTVFVEVQWLSQF